MASNQASSCCFALLYYVPYDVWCVSVADYAPELQQQHWAYLLILHRHTLDIMTLDVLTMLVLIIICSIETAGSCQCRPFLLPCFVSAVMAFLAWMSNLFLMSETHPQFASKYKQLADADEEVGLPSEEAIKERAKLQELQMSAVHHTDNYSTPKHSHQASAAQAGLSEGPAADAGSPATKSASSPVHSPDQASRKSVQFTTSQSATQESQLQLSVSSSDSSSSGILALRSASTPLEVFEDRSKSPSRSHRPQRAPSLELVLPDAGADSDMGAIPGALQAAANKCQRKAKSSQLPPSSGHSKLHKAHSAELNQTSHHQRSASADSASEQDSELEKLLPDQRPSRDTSDLSEDHVVNVDLSDEPAKPWYKQGIVTVCLAGGGLITLFMNYLDELAPIFASAQPSAGGLGMPEHEFAWPLTFGGLVLMLYSLFLYPKNQKRWGYKQCCKIGLLATIPASLILPFAHTFVQIRWATQACMFVGVGVRSIAKIMALASSTIIINTVAPMKQIGSVNGASQTVNALARAVGPFSAGILWGLCADSGIFGKEYIPFVASIVGLVATDILYMYIRLPE